MTDLNTGSKQCSNCKQMINLASFMMHEPFCLKNIVICDLCNNPYNKHQKEDHIEEFHELVRCECGESIEKMHMHAHKLESCRKRQKECQYCELSLDFDQFEKHVEFCGSRTELCVKCSRYIKIKDLNKHEDTNCEFPEAKPPPERKIINSRPVVPAVRTAINTSNSRGSSAKSLDKNYLNQFVRVSSRASMSMLPCEFCNDNYTSNELLKHQNECDMNPALTRYQNYGQSASNAFMLNQLIDHQLNISPPSRIQNVLDDDNDESITDKIPCEFCNKLFTFDAIIIHQTVCDLSNVNADPELNQVFNQYEASTHSRVNPPKPKINSRSNSLASSSSSKPRQSSASFNKVERKQNIIESRLKIEPRAKIDSKLRVKRGKSPFLNLENNLNEGLSQQNSKTNKINTSPEVSRFNDDVTSPIVLSKPKTSAIGQSKHALGSVQQRIPATRTKLPLNSNSSKISTINPPKTMTRPKKP